MTSALKGEGGGKRLVRKEKGSQMRMRGEELQNPKYRDFESFRVIIA